MRTHFNLSAVSDGNKWNYPNQKKNPIRANEIENIDDNGRLKIQKEETCQSEHNGSGVQEGWRRLD